MEKKGETRMRGRSITLVLKGRIPSAKNSRNIVRIRGRSIPLKSKAYQRFSNEAPLQIEEQLADIPRLPLTPPYDVRIGFKMKGLGATDGDNMESAIFDLLQATGIIEDDKHIHECSWKKIIGAKDYQTVIYISSL